MIDITKLTPLDARIELESLTENRSAYLYGTGTYAEAEFQLLARRVFDLLAREKWGVEYTPDGWLVTGVKGDWIPTMPQADPFTAVAHADDWLTVQGFTPPAE